MDKQPNTLQNIRLFWKLDGQSLVIVVLWYRRMGHAEQLKIVFIVFILLFWCKTHMPNGPLYIIMWPDNGQTL